MVNIKLYMHYIIHILLAAAIVLLLLVRPCVKVNAPNSEPVTLHDTIYKDSIIYVSAPIPQPITKVVTRYDTIYRDNVIYVDSSQYTANYYSDSIYTEYGKIQWYAATTGVLLGLDAQYQGRVKETIQYRDRIITEQKYKTGLYITSGIGYDFANNATADIGLSIMTKRGKIFGYEYDFINRFHKIKTGLRLF